MLTAHLNQISHLKIRVLNTRTAISDINKYILRCFVIFILYCTTYTQHEVGCLLFYLVVEGLTLLLGHFGDLLGAVEGEEVVYCGGVKFIHGKYIEIVYSL
jgi:hypothetical protein